MGLLQTAAAEIESIWQQVETVVEADVKVVAAAAKTFFTAVEPSVLSALLQVAADAGDDLITSPGTVFTDLLNQAEALGSSLWNTLEPQAKTSALQAVVSIAAVNAAAAGVAPATTVAPPATPPAAP